GRGNQMRVTVVLADDVVRDYADDLLVRERTYRRLVDGGRLVPTQNHGLDEFERTLADAGVARIAAQAGKAESDAETLEQNRRLLEKLNPGRVFRIHFPVAELVRRWTASLRAEDTDRRSSDRDLELLNAMLPTRL